MILCVCCNEAEARYVVTKWSFRGAVDRLACNWCGIGLAAHWRASIQDPALATVTIIAVKGVSSPGEVACAIDVIADPLRPRLKKAR